MFNRLIGIGLLTLTIATGAAAQSAPTPPVGDANVAVKIVTPASEMADQPIPADADRAVRALVQRDGGIADAMAILQKERDAITAELNRMIARLQAAAPAGFELGPQLTYVRKKGQK